jgi:N utilization substance protein A
MNTELMEALDALEREKNISKDALMDAIELSLLTACKNHFGTSDNMHVKMDRETGDFSVLADRTVVENVTDPVTEISLSDAQKLNGACKIGDVVQTKIESDSFGRIATMNAKNVITQKIREEERNVLFSEYIGKEHDIITGTVQQYMGKNVSIDIGKTDAILREKEMVKGEHYYPGQRLKVYVLEVRDTPKGPKIFVSRTHRDFVKRLFEQEVAEVREGIVEIKGIAREAGSRTKMAVYSNDPDVDPVGACVGMNGSRVNAVVDELGGEKIDIINWSDSPAQLIENALSPAKVIYVIADADAKEADVVVPDYQLSLAIGKEGQNARLAAKLTGFKIDIKSESQAKEAGEFIGYDEEDYFDEEDEDDGYALDDLPEDGFADEDLQDDGFEPEEGYEDGAEADGAGLEEGFEEEAPEDGDDAIQEVQDPEEGPEE